MPGYALIWVFAAFILLFILVVTLIYYLREAYRWLRRLLRRQGNGAPMP
ncbi:MAG TPA: hypothetical protein VL359_16950 [bacterium]|nr:hypothetical protein [bacterium]